MAIRKMKTQRTDARLQLEAEEPVELPPAEIEESAVVLQFESVRPFVAELLDTLRAGAIAELVPVMLDGSTFAVHGPTRTFWIKLWHSSPERTRIDRVQILSCLPSTRGMQIVIEDGTGEDDDDLDDDDGAEYADNEDEVADSDEESSPPADRVREPDTF